LSVARGAAASAAAATTPADARRAAPACAPKNAAANATPAPAITAIAISTNKGWSSSPLQSLSQPGTGSPDQSRQNLDQCTSIFFACGFFSAALGIPISSTPSLKLASIFSGSSSIQGDATVILDDPPTAGYFSMRLRALDGVEPRGLAGFRTLQDFFDVCTVATKTNCSTFLLWHRGHVLLNLPESIHAAFDLEPHRGIEFHDRAVNSGRALWHSGRHPQPDSRARPIGLNLDLQTCTGVPQAVAET
jgi:hypothetical protein